jgi:hypothetical protein
LLLVAIILVLYSKMVRLNVGELVLLVNWVMERPKYN